MCGIKIPQYEFALKMQGGLMREGGHICGTLRYKLTSLPGLFEKSEKRAWYLLFVHALNLPTFRKLVGKG